MDLLCGIFPKFWKKSAGFKEDDAVWGDQPVFSNIIKILVLGIHQINVVFIL